MTVFYLVIDVSPEHTDCLDILLMEWIHKWILQREMPNWSFMSSVPICCILKPVFKTNFLIPTLVHVKKLSIICCLPKHSTNSLTWQRSNFPTLFSTKTPMKTSWSVFCSAHGLSLSLPLLLYLIQLPHTISALENLTLAYLTKPHPSLWPNSSPTSFWK